MKKFHELNRIQQAILLIVGSYDPNGVSSEVVCGKLNAIGIKKMTEEQFAQWRDKQLEEFRAKHNGADPYQ